MHLEKKERKNALVAPVVETKKTLWEQMQLLKKKYGLRLKAIKDKNFYLHTQYKNAFASDNLHEMQRIQQDIKMSLLAQADRISELPHKIMIYGKRVQNDFFLQTDRPKVVSSFHLMLEERWKEYLVSLEATKNTLETEDLKASVLHMLPSIFAFEGNITAQYTEEGIVLLVDKKNDYENIFDMVNPLQDDPYLYFSQLREENPFYCLINTKHLFGATKYVACICTEETSRQQQDVLKSRALQELHNQILSPEVKEDATYHLTHYLPYRETAESYLKDNILVGIAGNIREEENLYHFAVTSQHPYRKYTSVVDHECLRRDELLRRLQIEGRLTYTVKKEHSDVMKFLTYEVYKEKLQFEKDAQEYVRQACAIMNSLSFHPRVKKLLSITPLHLWKDLL